MVMTVQPGYTLEQAEEDIANLRGDTAVFSEGYADLNTVTAASMTDLSTVTYVPADPSIGDCFRITCGGYGTQGSTRQDLTFGFYLGGAPVGTNIKIVGAAAAMWNVSDEFRWNMTVTLMCIT